MPVSLVCVKFTLSEIKKQLKYLNLATYLCL
jgi:hypothetical protein